MATTHPAQNDTSFASMLEDRIAAGPARREAPERKRTDHVGRPTWDWLSASAVDEGGVGALGGAARYSAGQGPTRIADDPARGRCQHRDPLAGLGPHQRRAMTFFHDLGEANLHAGSTVDEIKGAYRRLARRLHPDAGPSIRGAVLPSDQSFIQLHRHYRTLTERLAA